MISAHVLIVHLRRLGLVVTALSRSVILAFCAVVWGGFAVEL
jgi:hypothetical protein